VRGHDKMPFSKLEKGILKELVGEGGGVPENGGKQGGSYHGSKKK